MAVGDAADGLRIALLESSDEYVIRSHAWRFGSEGPDPDGHVLLRTKHPQVLLAGAVFLGETARGGRPAHPPALVVEIEERVGQPRPGWSLIHYEERGGHYHEVSRKRLEKAEFARFDPEPILWEGRPALLMRTARSAAPQLVTVQGGSIVLEPMALPTGGPKERVFAATGVDGPGATHGVFASVDYDERPLSVRFRTARRNEGRGAWSDPLEVTRTDPGHMGPDPKLGEIAAVALGKDLLLGLYGLRVVGFENNETWARVYLSRDGGKTWVDTHVGPDQPGASDLLRLVALPARNEVIAIYVLSRPPAKPSKYGIHTREIVSIVLRRMAIAR
jgi:hypothetical protein